MVLRIIQSSLALCVSTVIASAAVAQAAKPPAAAAPSSANAEPLSRTAFIATMDAEYRKLDGNKDGVVTRLEVEAQQQRLATATATQRARQAFARMDADRNGQLSADEFVRANVAQVKADATAVMNRLDANRDQKVTLVEYRTLTLSNFDRLDSDKDGVISSAERRGAARR